MFGLVKAGQIASASARMCGSSASARMRCGCGWSIFNFCGCGCGADGGSKCYKSALHPHCTKIFLGNELNTGACHLDGYNDPAIGFINPTFAKYTQARVS